MCKGREKNIDPKNIEDRVKECIGKKKRLSDCARELGIDINTVYDILSKIQNKESLDKTETPKSVPLEKEIDRSLNELIQIGESDTLEFKASMLYPVPTSRIGSGLTNTENLDQEKSDLMIKGIQETLKNEVITTISAFMNSSGGILLVGVMDNGMIYGLENDFKVAGGKKDWDTWLQILSNLIRDKIGAEFVSYVRVERVIHENKTVAKIVVKKSRHPIYIEKKDATFYIRSLNTSVPLNTKQAYDYITDHWKSI